MFFSQNYTDITKNNRRCLLKPRVNTVELLMVGTIKKSALKVSWGGGGESRHNGRLDLTLLHADPTYYQMSYIPIPSKKVVLKDRCPLVRGASGLKEGCPWSGVQVVSKEGCSLVRGSSGLKRGVPFGQEFKWSQRRMSLGQEFKWSQKRGAH